MNDLTKLAPAKVFSFFRQIAAIHHGSGNTAQIAQFCLDFAAERGLKAVKDAGDNVIIYADGTPGYENSESGYSAWLASMGGSRVNVVISEVMTSNACTAISPIGMSLSFLPFPNTLMKPSDRYRPDIPSPAASETRRPQLYSTSSMALSRFPIQSVTSTDPIMASTSSTDKTVGRYLPSFG